MRFIGCDKPVFVSFNFSGPGEFGRTGFQFFILYIYLLSSFPGDKIPFSQTKSETQVLHFEGF